MEKKYILGLVLMFVVIGFGAFEVSSYYNWYEANCYNSIENASSYIQERCSNE